jgi:hypothetical protein
MSPLETICFPVCREAPSCSLGLREGCSWVTMETTVNSTVNATVLCLTEVHLSERQSQLSVSIPSCLATLVTPSTCHTNLPHTFFTDKSTASCLHALSISCPYSVLVPAQRRLIPASLNPIPKFPTKRNEDCPGTHR